MKWSLKIGSVAGIGIFVHWTFLLLIGWILWLNRGETLGVAIEGVVFILSIFGCVVLHELGHALMGRHFGVRTRDITLLPIGGVARLERIPEVPSQEFWIAVAGPAVNVVIAALLYGGLWAAGALAPAEEFVQGLAEPHGHFLERLMIVNVALVVFNMIPAFPMDGGRVLRALLAASFDYVRATQVAAVVGQVIAVGFFALGLFFNPFLLIIAVFVYFAAQAESHSVSVRAVMRGLPVREAMISHFRALSPDDTLQTALDELRAGAQQDFPVVEEDRVVGLLARGDLMSALAEGGPDRRVGDVMRRDCLQVEDTELLERTFERMREHRCSSLAVTRGGRLVGMLTLENVGELMMINSALRRRGPRRRDDNLLRRR